MNIVETADGSLTLFHAGVGEHYHSKHGALQESRHVFLKSGTQHFLSNHPQDSLSILEVGFGTGLNYLVTADYCAKKNIKLNYVGIERYPLEKDTIIRTENTTHVATEIGTDFLENYKLSLASITNMVAGQLSIAVCDVYDFQSETRFDVIYFDAFAAIHQPEMWSAKILAHVCSFLKTGGVFVTYAITGDLKRTMKSLGFAIEKAPGAPGKREML